MISKDELKELLSAISTIAIVAATLRDRLILNDFTREEAVKVCEKVVVSMMTPGKSNTKDANDETSF